MFTRDLLLVPGYGAVTPVAAWRASAEQRARALGPGELARVVAGLRRDGDRRSLTILYGVATGLEARAPGELREALMVAAVDDAIARGQLLLVRGDGSAPSAEPGTRPAATPEDRLIDSVMDGRGALPFEGRRYRFTPGQRWSQRDGGREYVPLPAQAARELVGRMEATLARTPADHAAWQAVADALKDPQARGGIVMLRHAPATVSASPKPDLPVVTPSQLAPRIAQQDWIELQLEWDDGTPFDGDFLLTLPGGRTTQGPPDEGGAVRVDGLDPGDCKLTFPGLFPAAGG